MPHPTATYRLQLQPGFPLPEAGRGVAYLDRLGVSDLYLSPLTLARPGSTHGYDVIDHEQLNPELGSWEDLRSLTDALRRRHMGLLLDVVPNHMCIAAPSNDWWLDVLEHGPSSPHADRFDIDWNPPKPDLVNKVLLPVLGEQFGAALEQQLLVVRYHGGAFRLECAGMTLPLAPKSWTAVLGPAHERLVHAAAPGDPAVLELESIITALDHLPPQTETAETQVQERRRERVIAGRRLAALHDGAPVVRAALEESLAGLNGRLGDPASFDRLEAMLDRQAYRLSFWRVAADEINYRRFFDINELAAIRVEDPRVFAAVHALAFALARTGVVTGLRIDHVDGLLEPARYLEQLQQELARRGMPQPVYVVVEKILQEGEALQPWPVSGTTGYEALAGLDAVFVDSAGGPSLLQSYREFTGDADRFEDVVYRGKQLVLSVSLSSELTVLARRLDRISEQSRHTRDFTYDGLFDALREVIACFPVYRTYVARDTVTPETEDQRHIERALQLARRRNPATEASVFRFIGDLLLLRPAPGLTPAQEAERRDFVLRFQQLTGPVMAKGLEDTACYRWFPLVALAEVGGTPNRFGLSLDAFHAANRHRLAAWPGSLVTTSTHDTKRSEDVRTRIRVLSEVPDEWSAALRRWQAMNAGHRTETTGVEAPTPGEEYLLYQTLIGCWPPDADRPDPETVERIQAYMLKAQREAKLSTSWISPNPEHEEGVRRFVAAVLDPRPDNRFLPDLVALQRRLLAPGLWAGVAEVLLKCTVPGVPDFYQGSETWQYQLVDPDNRGVVDLDRRAALLDELDGLDAPARRTLLAQLCRAPADDRLKLLVTRTALRARRQHPDLYHRGSYLALEVEGPHAESVIAFARVSSRAASITLTGRWFVRLPAQGEAPVGPRAWGGTAVRLPADLAGRRWRELLSDRTVQVTEGRLQLAEVFADLPLALLHWPAPDQVAA